MTQTTTRIQQPFGSGYSFHTTAFEAIGGRDLNGHTAIVTGGYAGIGLATTLALRATGAHVIVPARNMNKAESILGDTDGVELAPLDLADPGSINAFAGWFLESGGPLHILINNAGIMATPFGVDTRGYEQQFAVNHLGHFQLTGQLWPALVRAGGARVVALSSRGHATGGVDFSDPFFQRRPYDKWVAYGQSKTANALFALALDELGAAHGVRAFSAHPGPVLTELVRHMSEEELAVSMAESDEISGFKTPEQGAATAVWAATNTRLNDMGGLYCEDVEIAQLTPDDFAEMRGVRSWATDLKAALRLWGASEVWTGVGFPTTSGA